MSGTTDVFEQVFLKVFKDFAMQTVSAKYLSYLREYIRDNPSQKKEVIKALELFLQELKSENV